VAEALRKPKLLAVLRKNEGRSRTAIVRALRAQQAAGGLGRFDAEVVADLILSAVDGISTRTWISPRFRSRTVAALLLEGLAPTLRPARAARATRTSR
jgi:hypothetical protein